LTLSKNRYNLSYWIKEKNIHIGEIKIRKTIDCEEFIFRISTVVIYSSDGSLSKNVSLGDKSVCSGMNLSWLKPGAESRFKMV
jgi:hypothetical protein